MAKTHRTIGHQPKKGGNKGIKKLRDEARRERAYKRGAPRPKE